VAETNLDDIFNQAPDEVQVIAPQLSGPDSLLTRNPNPPSLLMKKLAQSDQFSADEVRDVGLMSGNASSTA
jgi:hypothetical protein